MLNRAHKRAFSLLLLTSERPLNSEEQTFLDGHLKTCPQCRSNVQTHARLQGDLRPQAGDFYQTGLQHPVHLSKIVNSVDRRRKMKKVTNLALSSARMGLLIVLLGAVLWIFTNVFPIQSPPIFSGSESQGTKVVPSAISSPKATSVLQFTPTPTYTLQRVEVITYTVLPGDTIFEIANKFNLKPETIIWSNYDILVGYNIALRPGMELNILPVDEVYYEWKEGDDLNAVASWLGVQPEDIIDWPGNHLVLETVGDLSQPNVEPGTMLVVPGGHLDFVDWRTPPYP